MTPDPITQAREAIAALESRTSTKRGEALDLAVNLLRTLTSEGAEAQIATIIFEGIDVTREDSVIGGQMVKVNVLSDTSEVARAVISHLLAQAIGEQP